jgi:hypothetical protein
MSKMDPSLLQEYRSISIGPIEVLTGNLHAFLEESNRKKRVLSMRINGKKSLQTS